MALRAIGKGVREGSYLDRFGAALLLVLASIIGLSLIDTTGSAFGSLITHALSGAALLVALGASGVSRRWRRVTYVYVLLVLAANIVWALLAAPPVITPGSVNLGPGLLWLFAAAALPVIVARRLVRHREITIATVLGAVTAYLQIAVAYAFLFQAIDALSTEPFFGAPVSTTIYMYISLQTISTLGYGDNVPVTDLGRLATMSEAVVGQVYLVTFVAMIVSLFAASLPDRRSLRFERDDGGTGDAAASGREADPDVGRGRDQV
ncbi:hypothetical protein N865_07300 [Intrasporangium oryzae NRRL B-24470]|uniref:Potassium channel domain-containing protein n=1 Tax=Intrasporangium oryzae NRRL B-24470 TaxID=1386089 RepID=W9G7W2_9MICO|nr:potassium channel family protein [Intrasporangium oryzae]EWT02110.1 hypothetical protein N865_07300 [Intrasporangium oryzae NRRL B-24470]